MPRRVWKPWRRSPRAGGGEANKKLLVRGSRRWLRCGRRGQKAVLQNATCFPSKLTTSLPNSEKVGSHLSGETGRTVGSLVWGNPMPTCHQAYRHTRLEGLFDHANLLRGRPAPTTLNRRDDLNAIGRIA